MTAYLLEVLGYYPVMYWLIPLWHQLCAITYTVSLRENPVTASAGSDQAPHFFTPFFFFSIAEL